MTAPLPRLASAAALAAALLASGCAAPQRPRLTYPPPPDTARVAHLRSFSSPTDLQTGFFQRLVNALVPHESTAVLFNPVAAALSPDERTLYVSLPTTNRVIAVDLQKGSFTAIGTTGQRRLAHPVGVATDAEGLIYVADRNANAVLVYDPSGKLLRTVGADRLAQPTGLAVDRKGQVLYVVNDANVQVGKHTVEVFALDGRHLRTMGGGRSPAPGTFNFPTDVAVDSSGNLYVSDMLNFRVQVFDRGGGLVRTFGRSGTGMPGFFNKIHGIGFDTFGNVYVADLMEGVQIFNDLGQALMSFGQGVAQAPIGVVVDSRNHIYVVDYLNAVHEFELVNTRAEDSRAPAPTPAPPVPPAPTGSP